MNSAFQIQHPDIHEDMLPKINEIINRYRLQPGSVITVLRECQDIVGYLPVELIDYIGLGMNIAQSHVFGVVSFYSLFSLKPKGRHKIKCCIGTACYVKGIKEVMDRIRGKHDFVDGETTEDRRFSLMGVRCLGACGLAPVMVINDDVYGDLKADKINKILEQYV